jgi:hypothetical protein
VKKDLRRNQRLDEASLVTYTTVSRIDCLTAYEEYDLLRDLSPEELFSAKVWVGDRFYHGTEVLEELEMVFGE